MSTTRRGALQVLEVSNLGATHTSLARTARHAEANGFDALLIRDDGLDGLDPVAAAAALAATTRTLGLVPQVHTGRQHPFGVARRLVGLDQVSHGRAGWAPVDEDPTRLAEAVEIVTRLWDSWPDGVVVGDKERAVWVETERISPVLVEGTHYSVRAPLDLHRGPQGHLLLVLPTAASDLHRFSPGVALEQLDLVQVEPGTHPAPRHPATPTAVGLSLRARAGLERVAA